MHDESAWRSVPLLGFVAQGQPGHSEGWGSLLEAHTLGKHSPRSRAARPSDVTKFPIVDLWTKAGQPLESHS